MISTDLGPPAGAPATSHSGLMAEARHPGAMPLCLRGAADQFPRARWEPSNEHLVIMSGDTVIGSLKKQTGGTLGDRWAWSITCVLPDPGESPPNG